MAIMNKLNAEKLNEEELQNVNGGYILWISWGTWEVINDVNGKVMERVEGFSQDAEARAKALGQSPKEVDWKTVDALRNNIWPDPLKALGS